MTQQHDNQATQPQRKPKPPDPQAGPPQSDDLPRWKVLLHNDADNTVIFVAQTICQLTSLDRTQAMQRTHEAHSKGISLLLTTHQERAELYQQQFTSKGLTVTIEAEEK